MEPKDMPDDMKYEGDRQPKSEALLKTLLAKKSAEAPKLNTSADPSTHYGKGNEVQVYAEDILVGYRYFDTANRGADLLFPFGYGLSYTSFKYSDASISGANGNYTVSVKVKNTGTCKGKETVQLYIGDDKASVIRPQKELKHFKKIELQPGEEQTVTFAVTEEDLKFYDEEQHQWRSEAGTFKAYVGSSSRDIQAKLSFEKK
ncbi:MAG: fibronectin type III-like domain-contianing protein [Prevotella sp.]|nr:fibronectin type III-like domain-contianing protein [Prevotella sp.]